MSGFRPPLTVRDVIERLPPVQQVPRLVRPQYTPLCDPANGTGVGMTCPSMADHMTDEGWQIFEALRSTNRWLLFSDARTAKQGMLACNNARDLMKHWDVTHGPDKDGNPSTTCPTILVQDKREWDPKQGDFRNQDERWHEVEYLASRHDAYKLTILKDAQHRPLYHRQSAVEMGVHAWVVYYHPDIVNHLATYTRKNDLIRTYHTIDPKLIGHVALDYRLKDGISISGAVSGAYPLRQRLVRCLGQLNAGAMPSQRVAVRQHPGYHRNGSDVKSYLRHLSHYKVAVCTSSRYGYALRKIIEATACGCRVVTDLPVDEVMPAIDGNLYRIHPDESIENVRAILRHLCVNYKEEDQRGWARNACDFYDYKNMGKILDREIAARRVKTDKTEKEGVSKLKAVIDAQGVEQ